MTRRLALLACLVLTPALARATDFLTAGDVMRICTSQKPSEETACNTYIAGSLDELGAAQGGKEEVCKPSGVSLRDLRGALTKYGQSHAGEFRGHGGSSLVNAMLKAEYPCGSR